jgi:hypothetical protein
MAIIIEEYSMTVESDGSVIATATWAGGDEWIVAAWPRYLTRNQSITGLTVAERWEERDRALIAARVSHDLSDALRSDPCGPEVRPR